MGQETSQSHWTKEQEKEFSSHLKEETKLLKQWIKEGRFKNSPAICGYEAEGWIINERGLPCALSDKLLSAVSDSHITPELSKFNFEINGNPFCLNSSLTKHLEEDFQFYRDKCAQAAKKHKGKIIFIGTYPDITQVAFGMKQIYPRNRYYAINDRIRSLRKDSIAHIHIKGRETLHVDTLNVMHEAETTSLQIHLQVDFPQAKDFYNASLIASPIMTALCANSPFVCGKELWEESRIPLFEQVISLQSYEKNPIPRVGLGGGFVQKCVSELFEQNLFHPVLLPEIQKNGKEKLKHLLFHNGTIWRWNRPLIGFNQKGEPHFRVEHRTPSAGPSLVDMQANILFFIGLLYWIKEHIANNGLEMSFSKLKSFFYRAAKLGFLAKALWLDGKNYKMDELILQKLIPAVWEQLKQLSLDNPQSDYLIRDVIKNRAKFRQNGSIWQKAFILKFGKQFDRMIQSYSENQEKNIPIYQWTI